MSNLWGREPAIVLGFVSAVISLAVGFGLDLTGEQVGYIMAAVAALISVITRSRVSPTASSSAA